MNIKNIEEVYLISDTHFNHSKIGIYCNRPENWQELIIENWNNIISDDDIILHLGDFSFGNIDMVKSITEKLNGKIYMIRGNHDRRGKKWFRRVGIEVIPSFEVQIKNFKYKFTHKPNLELPKKHYNIHGHWHEKCPFLHETKNNSFGVNVSVEMIDYTPVQFIEIIEILKGYV